MTLVSVESLEETLEGRVYISSFIYVKNRHFRL